MLGWEDEFDSVIKDLTESRKRLKALKELVSSGKVSKVTHDRLFGELNRKLLVAEEQRRTLLTKLNGTKVEMDKQSEILSRLVEFNELRFATGEFSEDYYEKVSTALKYGLDESNRVLASLQEAVRKLEEMAPAYSDWDAEKLAKVNG